MQMKPLLWRAASIPIGGGEVDLQPLMRSMPKSKAGCVFRDFVVPPGMAHVISNATAWASRPASHETIVKSLQQLTGNDELGGHNGRHVLPEVGRGLQLPKQMREALGYWRAQPTLGDPSDAAAVARALTKACERQTRAGALASCADRYSSVDAAPVEQDQARVKCMLATRALRAASRRRPRRHRSRRLPRRSSRRELRGSNGGRASHGPPPPSHSMICQRGLGRQRSSACSESQRRSVHQRLKPAPRRRFVSKDLRNV